ncbi:Hint domain-containing protein [Asaia sp. BMEF1]|uniref:Hint domain-containing protein n=1 Tax=Asaia sp. BMEF1 TaxID=3155932 RepID=UPI003F675113
MATYNVSSGQTVSNTLVYGDVETVYSGGVTQDQHNGGQRFVLSGGIVRNGVVSSGGKDYISSGGSSYQGVIQNGGIRYLSSGATGDNPFIAGGGTVSAATGATVSALNAFSGGVLSAASGAVVNGGNVATGASITANPGTLLEGTINVSSGSTIVNGTLTGSGAVVNATTGALVKAVSVGSNTRLYLGSGATGSANLVNGGTLELAGGSKPVNNRFGSVAGGTIIVDSGASWNNANDPAYAVTSGNTLVIRSGASVSGTLISPGGTTIVSSGGLIVGSQTVSSGGTLVLNGTAGAGSVLLSGDGAHLVIDGMAMPTNTISGWSPADTINLASIPARSVTSVTTTSTGITFHTTTGTYSLKVPGADSYGYALSSDSNGGLIYATCFAEGTAITTPSGEANVETLVPGTMVMTPIGPMPVKWLGHKSITVTRQLVPEESWLVRIRKGALADDVPSRDLLVTQEHCLIFDNKLVPARMLVNGTSVLVDRTINSYTYYHIELDSHEGVWAENTLTESYRDTGNRSQFDNHTVTALFGGLGAIGSNPLHLETSRAFVEPIHTRISERAGIAARQSELTDNPDIYLVANLGQVLRPLRRTNERVIFLIPAGIATVRVVSRTSRPSETIGPFVDDRRDLGVLIGQVSLFEKLRTVQLTAHLSTTNLPGWHGLESPVYRWTKGDADLPLNTCDALTSEPCILSIQIVSCGPYLRAGHDPNDNLRRAG